MKKQTKTPSFFFLGSCNVVKIDREVHFFFFILYRPYILIGIRTTLDLTFIAHTCWSLTPYSSSFAWERTCQVATTSNYTEALVPVMVLLAGFFFFFFSYASCAFARNVSKNSFCRLMFDGHFQGLGPLRRLSDNKVKEKKRKSLRLKVKKSEKKKKANARWRKRSPDEIIISIYILNNSHVVYGSASN